MKGSLTVISGPSAVGKGTLVSLLAERYPQIWVSISATTRAPRVGEAEGVHYYFLNDDDFDDLLSQDGFLEWAQVHGTARYGTLREPVAASIANGKQVILEIDLQGARQVRQSWPDLRTIFIAPPDWQALLDRLAQRRTETPDQITRRLQTAEYEMKHADEFDHVVVNDDLDQTVNTLVDLLGLEQSPSPN